MKENLSEMNTIAMLSLYKNSIDPCMHITDFDGHFQITISKAKVDVNLRISEKATC
jgi:hypothetical protein